MFWEYLTVYWTNATQMQAAMCKHGEDGWELVCCMPGNGVEDRTLIFKRPLPCPH